MTNLTPAGFLNLNKPAGWTSHDCVARVRRLFKLKKVGHGGTLDPAATGVLPIALGRATRLIPYLAGTKAYRAVIRFGVVTSTDDLEGEIIQQQAALDLTLPTVTAILPQFVGTITQIPPQYSAIQVDGQRLYKLARQGQAVDVPARTVAIFQMDPSHWQPGTGEYPYPELTVDIACGSGTYIRAIARDVGIQIGTGATLAALTRTNSSGFSLANSYELETLEQLSLEQRWDCLTQPDVGLTHLPRLTLPPDLARRWQQGQKLEPLPEWVEQLVSTPVQSLTTTTAPTAVPPTVDPADPADPADRATTSVYRIYDQRDRLLGIGMTPLPFQSGRLVPKMVFRPY